MFKDFSDILVFLLGMTIGFLIFTFSLLNFLSSDFSTTKPIELHYKTVITTTEGVSDTTYTYNLRKNN